jgi:hypothetical protein
MKLKHKLAGVLVGAALLTGAGATTAMAGPTQWQNDYYDNTFHSLGSCENRGDWIIGAPPWGSPGIVGVDRYKCLRHRGDAYWSMNIRWYGRWAT